MPLWDPGMEQLFGVGQRIQLFVFDFTPGFGDWKLFGESVAGFNTEKGKRFYIFNF